MICFLLSVMWEEESDIISALKPIECEGLQSVSDEKLPSKMTASPVVSIRRGLTVVPML